ncbi:unnamed protein product, partial [marine sediment metagenome]
HGYLIYWLPEKAFTFFKIPENLTRLELQNLVPIVPNVTI